MILETTLQTILLPPNLLAELNRSGWSFLLTEFGFPRLMTMEARTVWVPRTRLWTRQATRTTTHPHPPSG